jgi:hypothetical protein
MLLIHFAAKAIYERQVKYKVKRANFATVLTDEAIDAAWIEKELSYLYSLSIQTTATSVLLTLKQVLSVIQEDGLSANNISVRVSI